MYRLFRLLPSGFVWYSSYGQRKKPSNGSLVLHIAPWLGLYPRTTCCTTNIYSAG
ncbi:hypothetical protein C8R44DRAFT_799064 [Mycena epipterygia]|nr:hypothetical protein C8R44DRAFT_799064 [Mycena epipterygia]